MQIALYQSPAHALDPGGYPSRERTAPVERVLEGELLRGERERRRRDDKPAADEEDVLRAAQARPAPMPQLPGNHAIAAYLRAADPLAYEPPPRLHLVA